MLQKENVCSQEDLVKALAQSGEPVTQATVSRDLAAIGAVRRADGYRLLESAGAPIDSPVAADELARMIRRHVVSLSLAHATIVVKTAPGHAQMLASVFDHSPPNGVVGTVAGDDTIFLAISTPKMASQVVKALEAAMQGTKP